jgi:hypothetical protein
MKEDQTPSLKKDGVFYFIDFLQGLPAITPQY